jgi:hypothetical protein
MLLNWGVDMVMIPRIGPFIICCGVLLFTLSGKSFGADGAPATQPVARLRPLNPYPYPIGAGVLGLAAGSTDVVVADVLETNPRKAIEGARDTTRLKVVDTLMGRPTLGETLDLYYHLLWTNERSTTLEPPKFEKGKRYIIFLRSHIASGPNYRKLEYELADQWLAVMPPDPRRMAEVEGAIRATQGDSRGAWCESVAAYRGRLVAYRDTQGKRPVINIFLDLNNVTGGENDVLFDLSNAAITWTMTDEGGKVVEPTAPAGGRAKEPLDQKVLVKSQGSARLPLSQTDVNIPDNRYGYLTLAPGLAWLFDNNEKTFYLTCKIEIPFIRKGTWYGTMVLPAVALPTN